MRNNGLAERLASNLHEVRWSRLGEGARVTANNALERTVNYRGALCLCEWVSYPAAKPSR